MIASTLSIALLAALNDRPTHHEIIGWIDVETILLLFAMMILVGVLTETGVFDHLAVYAYKVISAAYLVIQSAPSEFSFFCSDNEWKNLAADSLFVYHHVSYIHVTR